MKKSFLALPILLLPVLAEPALADVADSTGAPRLSVRAMRLAAPVRIDGVLDEPVWQGDQVIDCFTQRDPVEGAPPSQRTEVRVGYDDEALYIGARLYDSAPDSIVSRLARRDVSIQADQFALYLDPLCDRRSGYYFMVNAAGTLYDGTLSNDGWEDSSWDGVWEGRARLTADGWSCEMRIPYSQLRFAQDGDHAMVWGVNFRRGIQRRNENDYVVFQPRRGSGFVSRFPDLVGLADVPSARSIELLPYVTGKAAFTHHPSLDPFHDGEDWTPNGGADLRMSLGSKLTLSATVNPDFGQVEVDPAVVNLSDVESFFQEKRPFFVEGSSLFNFGQEGANDYWGFGWWQPTFFYSRRVGRTPQGIPDHDFADVASGTSLLGAAKVTGKLGPSWNFATLHALTGRETGRFGIATSGIDGRDSVTTFAQEVEPPTYYSVLRMQKEFPERRQGLGFMLDGARRDIAGTPLADALNTSSLFLGVDGWTFLDHGKTWVVSGYGGLSRIAGSPAHLAEVQQGPRHYFQRPDNGSVEVDPAATALTGTAGRLWLNRQNGNMLFNAAAGFLSPGFDVNDIGFMSRTDLINAHVGGGYKWTTPTRHRKYQDWIGATWVSFDFAGNRTSQGVWTKASTEFQNNNSWEYRLAFNPGTIDNRNTRGGPAMLRPHGFEVGTYFDTDGKSKLFYFVDTGGYVQPTARSYNYWCYPGVEWKPASNLTLRVGPGYEQVRESAQYVDQLDDPAAAATFGRRYIFATLDQRTVTANIRLNWAFSPTLALQFYGQPLIVSGEYTGFKALAGPRSFEFEPYAYPASSDPSFNYRSLRGNAVLRWEYRPGSALFLVWTQERTDSEDGGKLNFGPSVARLFEAEADNIFLVKMTYYFSP